MAWTNILKPTESSVLVISTDAQPFGLLMAITSLLTADSSSITTGWTGIAKPAASVGAWTNTNKPTASVGAWTNVAKPT